MNSKNNKADNLKNRRGKWYARVYYTIDGQKKEKQIPLKTSSKVVARERKIEVNKVAKDIKRLLEFDFPWISDESITKVKRFTLETACKEWIDKRKGKMRKSTIEINELSLKHLTDSLGKLIPLDTINNDSIEKYANYLSNRGLNDTSININLRTIKAMFRYYLKVGKLDKIPLIEQIPIDKKKPIYITDKEFSNIMEIKWLDSFYKRVFFLYRETGMRLNEPKMSVLDGYWIDIPNESKGKEERNIELDDHLKSIFIELKEWLKDGYGSKLVDFGDHFSKKFKKCLRHIKADESKHFHSLRHTYAVRSLIKGTSIYDLKLLMGHSSVTTTEVYSEMNLKRVKDDFPTIADKSQNSAKIGKSDTRITDTGQYSERYVA